MNALIRTHQDTSVLDGFIAIWEGDFLPEISEIAKRTFTSFWEVGPQLSPAEWAESGVKEGGVQGEGEFSVEDRQGEAIEFLDRAQKEEGDKSVLVISSVSHFAFSNLKG